MPVRKFVYIFLIVGTVILIPAGFLLKEDKVSPEPAPVSVPVVLPEQKTYTLLFTGDIMLGRSVEKRILKEQDPLYPFVRIADVIQKADLAVANLEGPISDRGVNQGSEYSFRFEPVGTVNALNFAGFDVVSIANNHVWDWGSDALVDTVSYLQKAGIDSVGAGKDEQEANAPLIRKLGDTRIAFLSYTNLYPKSLEASGDQPGISRFDLEAVKKRIQVLKSTEADLVVISMHWGEEYATSSNYFQKETGRALIDAGADLIIGTHPHVVQEVERYRKGYIVYSLGNFVFDQYFSKATMTGLMFKVILLGNKIIDARSIPITLTPTFQPYIPGTSGDPMVY